jgi:hypothetical protein
VPWRINIDDGSVLIHEVVYFESIFVGICHHNVCARILNVNAGVAIKKGAVRVEGERESVG